jgi:hypothetical protein
MTEALEQQQIGPLVIQLMRGVLERDQAAHAFQDLVRLRIPVADYLAVIGLELFVDEVEGYAFVRQRRAAEEEAGPLPRLVVTRPLSYPVSLLCVLLRKKLVEADASGDDARVVLRLDQIVELMRVYLPGRANEAKLEDQIERHVAKVVELGFLRPLRGQEGVWEVRRILKAFVDADWLATLDEKLEAYRIHGAAGD